MRVSLLLIAGAGIATAAACNGLSPEADCTQYGTCPVDGGLASADAGFDVVAPPGCDLTKSPKDSPECIDNSVGVFVAPNGDDSAAGTKSVPFKTIAKGVEAAAARGLPRVYVCEGTYDKSVEVKSPVSIYGGLSCAWAHTGVKPKLAPPKGVALRVTKVSSAVLVEDMEIVGSADASTPGDSAIAAFVSESGNVTFRNDALSAGAGTTGAKGASRSNYTGATATKGGDFSGTNGGTGPTCACVDGSSSTGGNGGSGAGGGLTDGSANPAVGTANSGASKASSCDPGLVGANGPAGAAAPGLTTAGTLTAAGWASGSGSSAPNGKPAQGGGGGGTKLNSASPGGGGGCGGCGGAGGEGGGAGGSSFSLVTFNSTVSIEGGALTAGTGGAGGAGANGQDGQGGGAAGTGAACDGGPGGNGAGGSGGGGGAGGHSAPIAFFGTEPKVTGATLTPGAKGASGSGGQPGAGPGDAGAAGSPGAEGKSQNVLAL